MSQRLPQVGDVIRRRREYGAYIGKYHDHLPTDNVEPGDTGTITEVFHRRQFTVNTGTLTTDMTYWELVVPQNDLIRKLNEGLDALKILSKLDPEEFQPILESVRRAVSP